MTPIRLYYHVTMIGDYYNITKELFGVVMESGLYGECESITIGALGDAVELFRLEEIVSKYPKATIKRHDERKNLFESFTLEMLREDAHLKDPFYAWYFHSKGVTSQNEADAQYRKEWRQYMATYMIGGWEKCYNALQSGYDICGSRMEKARNSVTKMTHSSGNFWCADSIYIKTLNDLRVSVFEEGGHPYHGGLFPEMWAFTGQPIIYMADKKVSNA